MMARADALALEPFGAPLGRSMVSREKKRVGRSKKADLIKAAYKLLDERNPEDVSIRVIAAAAGCTTGAVYRHFDSVDHLLLVACVKFLEDYMADLSELLTQNEDPLYQHVEMWRSFGRQAFAHVDAFELMFWKANEDALNDAIFTYYQEFPESWRKLSGFQVMLFFSSNIQERNLLTLNRCMAPYKLSKTTIDILNELEICSFHGLMMDYRDWYREAGKAQEGLERYMQMLDYMLGAVVVAAQ